MRLVATNIVANVTRVSTRSLTSPFLKGWLASLGMQRVVLFEARWPHSHGRTGPGSQAPV